MDHATTALHLDDTAPQSAAAERDLIAALRDVAIADNELAKLQALRNGAVSMAVWVRQGFIAKQTVVDRLYEQAQNCGVVTSSTEASVLSIIAQGLETLVVERLNGYTADEGADSHPDYGRPVPRRIEATPYQWVDPASIPPREWLYGRRLIRKFVSSTVAPGGVGKTSIIICDALPMVTHRPLVAAQMAATPLRVWIWNWEDPREEIDRRVAAACLHYGLAAADIDERLFLNSGRDQCLVIASPTPTGVRIARPITEALVAEINARKVDVLVIDPFVSCHEVSENDNVAVDKVIKEWGWLAEQGNCAVELVHHVRKLGDGEATVESARGAIAFVAGCRDVRVLNVMTKEEGTRAGIQNNRLYFRTYSGKANLAPPMDKSEWFELKSVDLENGPPGHSDHVQVVVRWQWPDAFEGLSTRDLLEVQKRIAAGDWRESEQAADWAGKAVAEVLRFDLSSAPLKSKVKALLKSWLASGALRVVKRNDRDRKERPFIEVGQWAGD
jgi:RecA-family ATPase